VLLALSVSSSNASWHSCSVALFPCIQAGRPLLRQPAAAARRKRRNRKTSRRRRGRRWGPAERRRQHPAARRTGISSTWQAHSQPDPRQLAPRALANNHHCSPNLAMPTIKPAQFTPPPNHSLFQAQPPNRDPYTHKAMPDHWASQPNHKQSRQESRLPSRIPNQHPSRCPLPSPRS
jgi:hypothetical protein